jgi:hypothetical protein
MRREPLLALAASLSLYAVCFALRRWIWPAEDTSGIGDSNEEDDEVPDDLPVSPPHGCHNHQPVWCMRPHNLAVLI